MEHWNMSNLILWTLSYFTTRRCSQGNKKAAGRDNKTPEMIKYIRTERIKQMKELLNGTKVLKEWNKDILLPM